MKAYLRIIRIKGKEYRIPIRMYSLLFLHVCVEEMCKETALYMQFFRSGRREAR